ncbi:MAG: terminase large subunit [Phycisphaerales bacterium]|nr:MAG: terminase large subunit [Phycisphaerales bacterium]
MTAARARSRSKAPRKKAGSVKSASQKWVRGVADEHALRDGCYFDEAAAARVVTFFSRFLRHSMGQWAGKPFDLEQWQREDVVYPLFGWKRADGARRHRLAYIEIPKKNGKSTFCSGLALYFLTADNEPGAEVYSAAADREQASIVYNEASQMVRASPELAAHLERIDSRKTIAFKSQAASYKVMSRDAFSAEGKKIHALIFDELHAQRDRRLWDAVRYGGAARRQPMIVSITTAGYDRHSICYEQHEYATKVRDGVITDSSFFQYIRAAERDDDWTDPKVWAKANPSLGITIDAETFAADCREAQQSPTKENAFRRYRLNQWTEQDVRWLSMASWDESGDEFDPAILDGQPCWMGLDLSATKDLSALSLAFRHPEREGHWILLTKAWAPEANAEERERRDRAPYVTWAKQGYITLTPGNVVDHDRIRAEIKAIGQRYDVQKVAFDPYNASQIAVQLTGDGFHVVQMRQGFLSLSEPTKLLETLVLTKRLHHGGHPVLRWCASNVMCEQDAAGNIKPSKSRSTEKIDCIVSGVMALGVASTDDDGVSVYETRGLVTL